MINRYELALKSGTNFRGNRSVQREPILDQQILSSASDSAQALCINRDALSRFAFVLSFLLVSYLVVGPSDDSDWGFVNALCPILLGLTGLWACYKIVFSNVRSIWTPIPWFMLSSSVYYGLGPLLFIFGSAEEIAYSDDFWPVNPVDLWRCNVLSTVGILTLTTAFLIVDKLLERARLHNRNSSTKSVGGSDSARFAAIIFLALGLPLRYLLVLPYTFGQFDFTLPGVIISMNCLVNLALFMLAYLGKKRGGLWQVGFWLLFVSELVSNFICYSKLTVLLVFIMVVLGRFQASRSVKELCLSGAVILGIYSFFLSPLVSWGRLQLLTEGTGEVGTAPIGVRLSVAARGLELWLQRDLVYERSEQRGWWLRLCYANQQTPAMHFYDSGAAGDSFASALYAWIPRLIWHDKPVINPGEDFTELISGNRGNCTAPGAFAEAYWNGGWLLLIFSSAYMGVIFAWLAHNSLGMLYRSQWLMLPCAFLSIWMGFRIDDWFAPTYVTGIVMYMAYYVATRLGSSKIGDH